MPRRKSYHKKHLERHGSSNFTKRRELAVQASLKKHAATVKKSKTRAAAFGSRNITDAAARRREIYLRYSRRPKTTKEKLIEKNYADQFANVVVGAFIIRKWIRSVVC